MILDLVPSTDPILQQPLEEFDPKSIDLEKIVAEMFATMYHYNGVGLSANQVGLPYRMFEWVHQKWKWYSLIQRLDQQLVN